MRRLLPKTNSSGFWFASIVTLIVKRTETQILLGRQGSVEKSEGPKTGT